MVRQIAIYGKGGVGKSSLAANLSAALGEMGRAVLLVGCDHKGDSTAMLHDEEPRMTVVELLMSGQRPALDLIVNKGFRDVACIEVGNSFSFGECAVSSFNRSLNLLRELDVYAHLKRDVVLFDIPGNPVCSGFSDRAASEAGTTLIVTSADVLSLQAANSLLTMAALREGGNQHVALVANGLNGPLEEALVNDFARQVNSRVIGQVPRSLVVKQCALYGKTVIETAPLSNHSYAYRRIARHLSDEAFVASLPVPSPMPTAGLKEWARSWGDRIYDLEHGIIRDCGGI